MIYIAPHSVTSFKIKSLG